MIDKIKSILQSGPKTALSILSLIILWMLLGAIFRNGDDLSHGLVLEENPPLTHVLVKRTEAEPINREISILGETSFSRRVTVTALTNGTVVSIPGVEGDLVSKSKTIIRLDDREAQAQFNHAESFAQQKEMEFEGSQKIFKEQLISEARLADSRSQFESAKAQKIQKEIQLESTRVKAPFEGVLQKILVEEGDYVRAGQELAEVLDFSPFVITGDVSETEAVHVTQGLTANARLIDGTAYHGKISYKSSQADKNSRSFNIELNVPNKNNDTILSGISSSITIPITHDKAHKISTSALEIDEHGKFGVKIINDKNIVSFHSIEVIKSSNKGLWVKGLPDISNVIIRGQGFVDAGDTVKPSFENEAADTPDIEPSNQISEMTKQKNKELN